jgi:hypothetical protein
MREAAQLSFHLEHVLEQQLPNLRLALQLQQTSKLKWMLIQQ